MFLDVDLKTPNVDLKPPLRSTFGVLESTSNGIFKKSPKTKNIYVLVVSFPEHETFFVSAQSAQAFCCVCPVAATTPRHPLAFCLVLNVMDDTHTESCGQSEIGDAADLPIDFEGADKITCNLCGHLASDPSPLTTPTTLALSMGKRPWNYRKIKHEISGEFCVRKPVGKYCRCCRNAFGAMGLHDKFSTIGDYYKHLCKPENMQESQGFANSVTEWIRRF